MICKNYVLLNYKPVFKSSDISKCLEEYEIYKECLVENEIVEVRDCLLKSVVMHHTFKPQAANAN